MDNIKITVDNGSVSEVLKKEILETFVRRISNLSPGSFLAQIIINPNLSGREVELLNDNAKRYIVDCDSIVDDETRIRLATLKTNTANLSILYIFEKNFKPVYKPTQEMKDSIQSYLPTYLDDEICFVSRLIKKQKEQDKMLYNTFCVSGDFGNGKTHLVLKIAERTNSTLWKLSYDDIDAENTGVIAKKTESFFKKIKSGDFVLIENADSFLCGRDINRFVKNILISVLNKRKDFFVFIETTDPSQFENDIKKNIFRYIYIKPLIEKERKNYLKLFLSYYGIIISDEELNSVQTTGLSVRDLKDTSYIVNLFLPTSSSVGQALSLALEETYESKLHSAITSDSPFTARKPKYKLDSLILPPEKSETIRYAASLVSNISLVYNSWNFSSFDPYPRAIINFYGKPGTGKTMCAHAIADYLGKDLLALNYAEIESKYIGDAPKKLESAFAYARQHDSVMFFDEADSFLGKRIEDVTHSADQALNSLRSTMLIQLEMFEGVVIFASNLRENYDKAFKSRFLYEIEFDLPNSDCRKKMINAYVSKIVPMVNANYSEEQIDLLANKSDGLSGREIKSTVLEALNKFAYKAHETIQQSPFEVCLPFELLFECFENKVRNLDSNAVVKTDLEEDKKKIAAGLIDRYGGDDGNNNADNNNKYSKLILLAYCAAWSDDVLNAKELATIKNAEKDLNVLIEKDYTIKENLPNIEELLRQIQLLGIDNQAIELCCRIVAADGEYAQAEVEFIHNICSKLDKDDMFIKEIDELILLIAKESVILNRINC